MPTKHIRGVLIVHSNSGAVDLHSRSKPPRFCGKRTAAAAAGLVFFLPGARPARSHGCTKESVGCECKRRQKLRKYETNPWITQAHFFRFWGPHSFFLYQVCGFFLETVAAAASGRIAVAPKLTSVGNIIWRSNSKTNRSCGLHSCIVIYRREMFFSSMAVSQRSFRQRRNVKGMGPPEILEQSWGIAGQHQV